MTKENSKNDKIPQQENSIITSTPVVGAVIFNAKREVLAGDKKGEYQFIQGSVDPQDNGNWQKALYREISEESGLAETQLMFVSHSYELITYPLKKAGRYPNATHRTVQWSCLCVKNGNVALKPDFREFDGGMKWVTLEEFFQKCSPHKQDMYNQVISIFSHQIIGPQNIEALTNS